MTQIVKCLKCGKLKEVVNNKQKSFECCGQRQLINEETLIEVITREKEKENVLNAPNLKKEELVNIGANSNYIEEDLEIEEDIEKEEKIQENGSNEEFKCPMCNKPVEIYQDCKFCGAEIIWQE